MRNTKPSFEVRKVLITQFETYGTYGIKLTTCKGMQRHRCQAVSLKLWLGSGKWETNQMWEISNYFKTGKYFFLFKCKINMFCQSFCEMGSKFLPSQGAL